MATNTQKGYSCGKCDGEDNDSMVMCDNCSVWYHFGCVGVNSSIEDREWSCDKCDPPISTIATISQGQPISSSSPKLQFSSSVMPPEIKATAAQTQLVSTNTTNTFSTVPMPAHGYVVCSTFAPPPISSGPVNSLAFTTPTQAHAATAQQQHSHAYVHTIPVQQQHTNAYINAMPVQQHTNAYINAMPTQPQHSYAFENAMPIAAQFSVDNSQRLVHLQLERQAEERRLRQYLDEKYQLLVNIASPNQNVNTLRPTSTSQNVITMLPTWASQNVNTMLPSQNANTMLPTSSVNMSTRPTSQNVNTMPPGQNVNTPLPEQNVNTTIHNQYVNSMIVPTPSQIAARHALPKELPSFNGDPDDWPLFISSFRNSTEIGGFTNAENLFRLQSCLKGKAREIVKSKLLLPALVPEIIQTLQMCFGRPEHIIERAIAKARNTPPPKDKLEALIDFAISVKNVVATIESCGLQDHLSNPMLVKELVDKLPNQHKLTWATQPCSTSVPVLTSFSNWLYSIAEAASRVVTPSFGKTASSNTHVRAYQEDFLTTKSCIVCKADGHKAANCDTFKSLALNQKWEMIKSNNMCRICLGVHRRKCNSNKECGISGCKIKHHPLLHNPNKQTVHATSSNSSASSQRIAKINSHRQDSSEGPLFRILPVNLHWKDKSIQTFAFMDEGSSVTLIDRIVFDNLQMTGVKDPLCLQWTGNTTRCEDDSMLCSLEISGMHSNLKYNINDVHTVEKLELPTQTIHFEELAKRYSHLTGLPITSYNRAKPMILIGSNNWKLAIPLKIREGTWDQPIAVKTRLGWTIQGGKSSYSAPLYLNIHTCECEKRFEELHELVKAHFDMDSPKKSSIVSADDRKAIETLRQSCQKVNGQYEVGLIWRDNEAELPTSYDNALKRHVCLARKMVKDENLYEAMQDQINNLVTKGYAKKLSEKEALTSFRKTWYLPIFIAKNPNKPKKLRLVWDAASKSNGCSLNDFLLAGPDLLQPLIKIILSFRVGKVAICGDIAEMFHRINVRKDDAQSQRFLWMESKDDVYSPAVYVMNALTFGINCAPCIAHFVRDYNADIFTAKYPRAVESIKNYHYVDDMIDSDDNEETVAALALQVAEIHAAGGFLIRNWISNSPNVLQKLNKNSAESSHTTKEWGETEKVLGMYWDSTNDVFKYICRFARLRRNVFEADVIPTKRECLQVLMSIFDPLGFVSCYTISLKILLQDIWRAGTGWDDTLPTNLQHKWKRWVTTIPDIAAVEVPRCYSSRMSDATNVQLHTFVDAGEFGYAAVCYLRVRNNDEVTVSLVAGKSKVAPLKTLSIPRMELQAAVIGVRLARAIREVQRIRLDSQTFWSDSKTVLRWLQMDPRNFQQYVMHRVGEILESTNALQWHWVSSKQNPADFATKTMATKSTDLWFSGPKFLRQPENEWPRCEDLGAADTNEMRPVPLNVHTHKPTAISINFEYFSSWKRLCRAVATFILYLMKLRSITSGTASPYKVSPEMTFEAKNFLIRQAQYSEYSEDIAHLKDGRDIEKSSQLIALNAYVSEEEILRMRGRTEYSNNHEDAIILPTNHHVTFLIVRCIHEQYHHMLHEAIINKVRCYYYIPRLRVLYKRIRSSCQICKNNAAKPCAPQMSPLPTARLGAFERPFTYTGIDYFGPLHVTIGRRREKRWGVLFTCLVIRAIHIEVAHSLDTSSCIMCISNFIARRGMPREVYTDNGTNFRACEKILAAEIKNINLTQYSEKFDGIVWKFNPPAAPHMGGAWERMIRSVKNALYAIHPSQTFNDETLKNAMCEIESIINSRPLTFVSIDSEDDEAITPNHMLLGSSDGYKPILQNDGDLRQRWYQTQLFADRFWKRWISEYTPILTKRCKWFAKQQPIAVGDVVIVVDDKLPRRYWPKGRIIKVFIAKDGQARRVIVQTQAGVLDRPVVKVAILDVAGK